MRSILVLARWFVVLPAAIGLSQDVPQLPVDGQPLGANAVRVLKTLEFLGTPWDAAQREAVERAAAQRDATALQELLDRHALFVVSLNPELRVKVSRGPAAAVLQQGGFTPVLVKVLNESTIASPLQITSPQAGPVYSGPSLTILKRQAQTELMRDENTTGRTDRFLQVEMVRAPPMTRAMSGLAVEYCLALIYCSESGQREATIGFDIGAGNQDLGFRGEVPVLFSVQPAVPVRLSILDDDGTPTAARLTIRDGRGHIYPPQAKRLSPDFFFQPHIYRQDGDVVHLPPGEFQVTYTRGPEYHEDQRPLVVAVDREARLALRLRRWIHPAEFGFYSGDHHIHAAGCSHYDSPTQGVTPQAMFTQVKGEGLNVGCVLTWGPCFDFQRQYFSPEADAVSEPLTKLKYDLEISGFGSAALGHVCLLNLKDQTYPGSEGTKTQGWPTWTVPVLRWTKAQGGFTGYPHSAFDVDAEMAAEHLLGKYDRDQDQRLSREEYDFPLAPEPFAAADEDGNGWLGSSELEGSTRRAADRLPNLAIPNMNGGGALEICVAAAEGVCDFISAMDTPRISEWNIWYHLMNCGIPLKVSGETDFPCMSGRRVGQGRVYVQLGPLEDVDFQQWCRGLAEGRSYVSDGYAHALDFRVDNRRPGDADVLLAAQGVVNVQATVAFAPEVPEGVAYGNQSAPGGRQWAGDTVNLHAPRSSGSVRGGDRLVELVVNGVPVQRAQIPADGKPHELFWQVPVKQSSWLAVRYFPQLHTNPVRVIVADRPIRASAASAHWCAESIRLLWHHRRRFISVAERPAAEQVYQRAIARYEAIAAECQAPKADP